MCLRLDWRSLAHAAHIWRICGCFGPYGPKSEPLENNACVKCGFFSPYIYIHTYIHNILAFFRLVEYVGVYFVG